MHRIQSFVRQSSFLGALVLLLALPGEAAQVRVEGPSSPASPGSRGPVDAPEIDPSYWKGLAVLLVGGVLVLTSRVRRRPATVRAERGPAGH